MVSVNEAFLALAGTIGLGFLGYLLFERTRVSDALVLIGLGVAVGPWLGLVDAATFAEFAPIVVTLALVMILFDGSLTIQVGALLGSVARAAALAFTGFAVTVAAVALVAWRWLGLDPSYALLLGAVVGGTCSTIIVPLAARLHVTERTRVTLDVESVVTDVLAVVTVVAVASWLALGASDPQVAARTLASAFSTAIVAGVIAGILWVRALKPLSRLSYNYMLTLAMILALYVAVDYFGGSGPMSVLAFGVVLGNSESFTRGLKLEGGVFGPDLRRFQGELTFLLRAFFFVWFGLLVEFSLFTRQFLVAGALLAGAVVAARLLVVAVTTAGARDLNKGLLSAMMPRGLTAAVLAALPATEFGLLPTAAFPEYAFVVIVITNLVSSAGLLAWSLGTRRGAAAPAATPVP